VARASLEELLLDYEDFLRQHGLRIWGKSSHEAIEARKFLQDESDRSDQSEKKGASILKNSDAETAANTMICLINQASYLLHRQLQSLERKSLEEGGFTESLYNQRRARRDKP
jgi:restriction system protein